MADTSLGKAYVQIVPSAEGISGSIQNILGPESERAGKSSGESFAGKFASIAKKALVAVGIGKMIGSALNEGGALQQSLGGIETLFKENAGQVKRYAEEAYRTTGLSANAYMQSVTGFSASLLQSLGGDTAKAGEIANMAMIDMSDNANKMGTDMASIQTAYQGFAKQNYTMLDNLRLGYGGTKTEMERLLKDAQAITGVKYDINSLSDVYNAIHVIQGELDITGTTAKEASTTLQGSFSAMQASFQNLLGNMATGGDVAGAIDALTQSVSTYLFGNFLPMVGNVVAQIPNILVGAVQGIAMYADEIINSGINLVTDLVQGIITAVPQLITAVTTLAQNIYGVIDSIDWLAVGSDLLANIDTGFVAEIPSLIESCGDMIASFIGTVMDNLPSIVSRGVDMVASLASGVAQNIPAIVNAMVNVLAKVLATIGQHLPQYLKQGAELIGRVANGMLNALPGVLSAVGGIISNAVKAFSKFDWLSIGRNIINGIVNGIKNAGGAIKETLMGFAKNAFEKVKNFFGIHSPSTLMRDQIGENIGFGMAEGIERSAKEVDHAMESLTRGAYTVPLEATMAQNSQLLTASGNGAQGANMSATININAQDYNSALDIAQEVKRILVHDMEREEVAYA